MNTHFIGVMENGILSIWSSQLLTDTKAHRIASSLNYAGVFGSETYYACTASPKVRGGVHISGVSEFFVNSISLNRLSRNEKAHIRNFLYA